MTPEDESDLMQLIQTAQATAAVNAESMQIISNSLQLVVDRLNALEARLDEMDATELDLGLDD